MISDLSFISIGLVTVGFCRSKMDITTYRRAVAGRKYELLIFLVVKPQQRVFFYFPEDPLIDREI